MLYESPRLPQEHISALKRVDLSIHGGIHGTLVKLPPYGLACPGMLDEDYAATGRVIEGLDPARGDVYAYESIWHDPAHTDEWFRANLPDWVVGSPLFTTDPTDLPACAQQIRRGHIMSPAHYAHILALAKGVRIEYADATAADRQAWLAEREQYDSYPPSLDEMSAFRDIKIVERLGAIAATMPSGTWRNRSKLAMTVGHDHLRGVKRHLRANGVRGAKYRVYSRRMHQRVFEDLTAIGTDRDPEERHYTEWKNRAEQLLAGKDT